MSEEDTKKRAECMHSGEEEHNGVVIILSDNESRTAKEKRRRKKENSQEEERKPSRPLDKTRGILHHHGLFPLPLLLRLFSSPSSSSSLPLLSPSNSLDPLPFHNSYLSFYPSLFTFFVCSFFNSLFLLYPQFLFISFSLHSTPSSPPIQPRPLSFLSLFSSSPSPLDSLISLS